MRERGGGGGEGQRGTWGESENRGRGEGGRDGGRKDGVRKGDESTKYTCTCMYMYKRYNAQPQEPSKERFQQLISS